MKINKVLHVFMKNVMSADYYHMGSTRDVRGRFEYFREREIHLDHLILKSRNDKVLLDRLQNMSRDELSGYQAVIFEHPRYPKALRYLKDTYPGIRLFIRSHNAEVFHQMHYALATLKFASSIKDIIQSYKLFRLSISRLMLDKRCSELAHGILSISAWESSNYWKLYAEIEKIFTVPYFLPSEYNNGKRSPRVKKNQCVCLMSPYKGRLVFLEDALRNYARCIDQISSDSTDWKFLVTGNLSYYNLPLPDNLIATGFIDSPFDLMLESKAMTLLSDYGFGFKTKILEAIEAKCYILLTGKLYKRLPELVKPYCFVVDPKNPGSFYKALESAQKPFPSNACVNEELKKLAFEGLDKAINQY